MADKTFNDYTEADEMLSGDAFLVARNSAYMRVKGSKIEQKITDLADDEVSTHNSSSDAHSSLFSGKEDKSNKDTTIPSSAVSGHYPETGAVKTYVDGNFPVTVAKGGTGQTESVKAGIALGNRILSYDGTAAQKINLGNYIHDRQFFMIKDASGFGLYTTSDNFNSVTQIFGACTKAIRKIDSNTIITSSGWHSVYFFFSNNNLNASITNGTADEWNAASPITITDGRSSQIPFDTSVFVKKVIADTWSDLTKANLDSLNLTIGNFYVLQTIQNVVIVERMSSGYYISFGIRLVDNVPKIRSWITSAGGVTEISYAEAADLLSKEDVANKDTSIPDTPTAGHYPTTQAVKDGLDGKLSLSGGTMTGSINMNSNNITFAELIRTANIAAKVLTDDVNFTSAVNMGNRKIKGLATPTGDSDAANKEYVDGQVAMVEGGEVYQGDVATMAGLPNAETYTGKTGYYFFVENLGTDYDNLSGRAIFLKGATAADNAFRIHPDRSGSAPDNVTIALNSTGQLQVKDFSSTAITEDATKYSNPTGGISLVNFFTSVVAKINGIITALGGKESTSNKDTSVPTTPTTGHYPTTGAVKDFVNGLFPLPIASGGTGAETFKDAQTNLLQPTRITSGTDIDSLVTPGIYNINGISLTIGGVTSSTWILEVIDNNYGGTSHNFPMQRITNYSSAVCSPTAVRQLYGNTPNALQWRPWHIIPDKDYVDSVAKPKFIAVKTIAQQKYIHMESANGDNITGYYQYENGEYGWFSISRTGAGIVQNGAAGWHFGEHPPTVGFEASAAYDFQFSYPVGTMSAGTCLLFWTNSTARNVTWNNTGYTWAGQWTIPKASTNDGTWVELINTVLDATADSPYFVTTPKANYKEFLIELILSKKGNALYKDSSDIKLVPVSSLGYDSQNSFVTFSLIDVNGAINSNAPTLSINLPVWDDGTNLVIGDNTAVKLMLFETYRPIVAGSNVQSQIVQMKAAMQYFTIKVSGR